jgi:YVTN family beta-propeller protein
MTGGASVDVINTTNQQIVDKIPLTGYSVFCSLITPDGNYIYCPLYPNSVYPLTGTRYIYAVSTASRSIVSTIDVGNTDPGSMAVTPNSQYLYVSNPIDGSITVIDTQIQSVVDTILIGGGYTSQGSGCMPTCPYRMTVTPNGATLYVANSGDTVSGTPGLTQDAASISVVNTLTESVIATIPMTVNSGPNYLYSTPNGAYIYVTDSGGAQSIDSLTVINTTTQSIVATIPIGYSVSTLAITQNGAYVYVPYETAAGDQYVDVINTKTQSIISTIYVGPSKLVYGLMQISITPDGAYAYVTATDGSHNVTIISTATNKIVAQIAPPGGGSSYFCTQILPDGSYAYVTNEGVSTITAINVATLSVVAQITTTSTGAAVMGSPSNQCTD